MSRKHKKNDFFFRRNNNGIRKEDTAMDCSKLRIRAGMAAVSALLILSPVVISAAGSLADPIAQEKYRISDSEQADSPYPLSADYSSTGSTTADAGSTHADSQYAVALPDPSDKETAVEDAGAFQSVTKSEYASESPAVDPQKEESSSGRTDDGSTPDSDMAADGSQTADTNAGSDLNETDKHDAGRELNETAADKDDAGRELKENATDTEGENGKQDEPAADQEDADDEDSADANKEDTDEDAVSEEAGDDGSEDQEKVDEETSGVGDTDSGSTEDPEEQDPEMDNEDENSDAFSNYGSNDFPGAITPEIVRIPADEWAEYGESAAGFLEREKDFFAAGTPIFFNIKGTEYSASIQNNSFEIEKTEDGTAVVIEAASLKDGTGVYKNVVEYVIRDACRTSDGKKGYLILTLEEARIELPEGSREDAFGKIAVSSVTDDHNFKAEARSIPAGAEEDDADRENETEAVDVRVSEKWSARIVWHEGNDVAEPRTYLFIPDLDEVFGDPASETCDRERVAMLSGFTGKAFCCEDSAVSVSSSGYLEGNGQPGAVILPVNNANIQFAWGGTNCSTEIFTGLDRIEPADSSEKEKLDQDDAADSDSTADAGTDTDSEADTKTEMDVNTEKSMSESAASRAAILISYEEEPEKTAGLSAGDTVEVSMQIKNSGSELLTDVEVSEILDDDAEITVAWDRSSDPDTVENILSEGETVPFTVNYTVTQDDIDAGKLVRKAEASAETTDRDAVEDEQTSEVILRRAASIDFSKEAAVQKISDAREGMSIRYYFTVTNSGNVTLRNIEVIDQMEGLSRIEYDWNESTDSRTGEGYLSPGEKVTASAAYTIKSADIRNGKIVNKAFARGETLQGEIIVSNEPEAPTSISQEEKEVKRSGSPETGDETDIFIYLFPAIVSFTILITSFVLGEIQRKKMAFDDEEKD